MRLIIRPREVNSYLTIPLLAKETIECLFTPIFTCTPELLVFLGDDRIQSCDNYVEVVAEDLKQRSYDITLYWSIIIIGNVIGNILMYWGFGTASERMNRRVRDTAFTSLVRQEISFFDVRAVGKITSELQEDATRIQTYSGDPIRQFLLTLSSLFVGLVLSFYVSLVFLHVFESVNCFLSHSHLFSLQISKVHVAVSTFDSWCSPLYGMGTKFGNGKDDGKR